MKEENKKAGKTPSMDLGVAEGAKRTA